MPLRLPGGKTYGAERPAPRKGGRLNMGGLYQAPPPFGQVVRKQWGISVEQALIADLQDAGFKVGPGVSLGPKKG